VTNPLSKLSRLYFNELNIEGRKTRLWEVTATASDEVLGRISFWGAWRKYTFSPYAGTVYDANCLRDIATFAEIETNKWRESLRERPATGKE